MLRTAKPKKFENPEPGLQRAVLVDIIRGRSADSFHSGQWKYNFKLVFQTEARNSSGTPFYPSDICSDSMYEMAKLRKYFVSWRGTDFTQAEIDKGIDIESYIGKSANVMVILKDSGGRLFANVSGIFPLAKGEKPVKPETYVRACHREDYVPVPEPEEPEKEPEDGVSLEDIKSAEPSEPSGPANEEPFTADYEDVPF